MRKKDKPHLYYPDPNSGLKRRFNLPKPLDQLRCNCKHGKNSKGVPTWERNRDCPLHGVKA